MSEDKPLFLQEEAPVETQSPLERAHELLREAVAIADELLTQLKVLGETPEEREKTFKALEGLTPEQLREAADREHEYLKLHRFLDGGEEVTP